MKFNTLILILIYLFSFYKCTPVQESSICLQIKNQYWLDLDTSTIYITYYNKDTVSIFSSEVGFSQQYQKCENNTLYSFNDTKLSDTFSIQKLRLSKDTLILEVVSNDFVQNGYLSKMKRSSKKEIDLILAPYMQIDTSIYQYKKNNMTIEKPR